MAPTARIEGPSTSDSAWAMSDSVDDTNDARAEVRRRPSSKAISRSRLGPTRDTAVVSMRASTPAARSAHSASPSRITASNTGSTACSPARASANASLTRPDTARLAASTCRGTDAVTCPTKAENASPSAPDETASMASRTACTTNPRTWSMAEPASSPLSMAARAAVSSLAMRPVGPVNSASASPMNASSAATGAAASKLSSAADSVPPRPCSRPVAAATTSSTAVKAKDSRSAMPPPDTRSWMTATALSPVPSARSDSRSVNTANARSCKPDMPRSRNCVTAVRIACTGSPARSSMPLNPSSSTSADAFSHSTLACCVMFTYTATSSPPNPDTRSPTADAAAVASVTVVSSPTSAPSNTSTLSNASATRTSFSAGARMRESISSALVTTVATSLMVVDTLVTTGSTLSCSACTLGRKFTSADIAPSATMAPTWSTAVRMESRKKVMMGRLFTAAVAASKNRLATALTSSVSMMPVSITSASANRPVTGDT